jgi:hypothetical protein
MTNSVSNEALWEKLSEIGEKMNQHLKEEKVSDPTQEQTDIIPELKANKDEIIDVFKKCIQGLGTHCDSHFRTMYKHLEQLEKDTEGIYKVLVCMNAILQEPKKQQETKPEPDKFYLNFKFFKVRKSSIVITLLGLLALTLTVFCMKQQNDYVLLLDEFYRQSITLREIQAEVDSLRIMVKPKIEIKKK